MAIARRAPPVDFGSNDGRPKTQESASPDHARRGGARPDFGDRSVRRHHDARLGNFGIRIPLLELFRENPSLVFSSDHSDLALNTPAGKLLLSQVEFHLISQQDSLAIDELESRLKGFRIVADTWCLARAIGSGDRGKGRPRRHAEREFRWRRRVRHGIPLWQWPRQRDRWEVLFDSLVRVTEETGKVIG